MRDSMDDVPGSDHDHVELDPAVTLNTSERDALWAHFGHCKVCAKRLGDELDLFLSRMAEQDDLNESFEARTRPPVAIDDVLNALGKHGRRADAPSRLSLLKGIAPEQGDRDVDEQGSTSGPVPSRHTELPQWAHRGSRWARIIVLATSGLAAAALIVVLVRPFEVTRPTMGSREAIVGLHEELVGSPEGGLVGRGHGDLRAFKNGYRGAMAASLARSARTRIIDEPEVQRRLEAIGEASSASDWMALSTRDPCVGQPSSSKCQLGVWAYELRMVLNTDPVDVDLLSRLIDGPQAVDLLAFLNSTITEGERYRVGPAPTKVDVDHVIHESMRWGRAILFLLSEP